MYDKGKIFLEKGWTDCHALDAVRKNLETRSMKSIDITKLGLVKRINNPLDVLDNSVLGETMKHFKGNTILAASDLSEETQGRPFVP